MQLNFMELYDIWHVTPEVASTELIGDKITMTDS